MNNSTWNKLSEITPEEEGRYLVCDDRGNVTLKEWRNEETIWDYDDHRRIEYTRPACFKQTNTYRSKPAENVYFWMELPSLPTELKNKAKIEAVERKIKKLKKQLSELYKDDSVEVDE